MPVPGIRVNEYVFDISISCFVVVVLFFTVPQLRVTKHVKKDIELLFVDIMTIKIIEI